MLEKNSHPPTTLCFIAAFFLQKSSLLFADLSRVLCMLSMNQCWVYMPSKWWHYQTHIRFSLQLAIKFGFTSKNLRLWLQMYNILAMNVWQIIKWGRENRSLSGNVISLLTPPLIHFVFISICHEEEYYIKLSCIFHNRYSYEKKKMTLKKWYF